MKKIKIKNNYISKSEVLLRSNYIDKYINKINNKNQKNYFIVDLKLKYMFEKT